MTKYQLTKPGGPWDYPTLGFSATNGAILDGTLSTPAISTAPDAYWAVYGGGSAETGITRYGTGTVTPTPEVTDGWVLAYDGTANTYTAQDLGDPESLVGAALSASIAEAIDGAGGGGIQASGDDTGATDTPAIQAALTAARTTGGGVVTLAAGGTFWLNAPLVIGSYTTLDATGATVRLAEDADCNMVHNYAYVNPVGTGTVTMAGGTNQITYTDGGLFETAAPGQRIKVPGAIAPGIYAMVATILANNTGTNTLTVPTYRSSGSGSVADVALIDPDKSITITGGTWDRGTVLGADTMDGKFSFVMRHVDGLRATHMTWATTGAGGVGAGGGYFWSMADVSNFLVEDITFGVDGAVRDWSGSVTGVISDGVHGNGPLHRGVIRDIYGNCGDDMVALMTQDGNDWGDVGGSITDIVIENVFPVNGWQAAVKVLAGPGDLYNPARPAVEDIRISNIGGSCGSRPVWIGDDNRWSDAIEGGLMDNVTIENVYTRNTNNVGAVLINGKNMGRITVRGVKYDQNTSTTAPIEVTNHLSDGPVVKQLILEDLDVRSLGSGEKAIDIDASATVTELVRRNWRLGTGVGAYNIAGTVTRIRSDTIPTMNSVGAGRVTGWFNPTTIPLTGTSTSALTKDKLYLSLPRVEAEDITISALALECTAAGTATTVARLGIYRVINTAEPYNVTLGASYAALLVDAGTVATDSGTGAKTVTLGTPLVIPAGTWFCIASVDQIAASCTRRVHTAGNYATTPWGGVAAHDSLGYQCVGMTGVTGALPSTFTPGTFEWIANNSNHGVQFRRSA